MINLNIVKKKRSLKNKLNIYSIDLMTLLLDL